MKIMNKLKYKPELIGGFYEIDLTNAYSNSHEPFTLNFDSNGSYNHLYFTNNGRSATTLALTQLNDIEHSKKILLPDYLCASILETIIHSKYIFDFYHVNKDLSIDISSLQDKITPDVGIIYYINYFGIRQCPKTIEYLKFIARNNNCLILEDLTQSLFSKAYYDIGFGDIIVGSLRKWLPITDGGLVVYKNHINITEIPLCEGYDEASFSELLVSVCRNRVADIGLINYLEFEKKANESRYIDYTPKKLNSICKNIVFNQNYEINAKKRISNYTLLYNGILPNKHIHILSPKPSSLFNIIPFGFVMLVDNRDKFYDYLVSHNIIPEIQWRLPLDKYNPGEDARYISKHNIMLQCDQRYSEVEMQYVVDIINNYSF